jgi:hypothetical protein
MVRRGVIPCFSPKSQANICRFGRDKQLSLGAHPDSFLSIDMHITICRVDAG